MIDVEYVSLENGIEYAKIDEVMYNGFQYILLSNPKDVLDACIRKISVVDNMKYINKLDDGELEKVLALFMKKNENLFV